MILHIKVCLQVLERTRGVKKHSVATCKESESTTTFSTELEVIIGIIVLGCIREHVFLFFWSLS